MEKNYGYFPVIEITAVLEYWNSQWTRNFIYYCINYKRFSKDIVFILGILWHLYVLKYLSHKRVQFFDLKAWNDWYDISIPKFLENRWSQLFLYSDF